MHSSNDVKLRLGTVATACAPCCVVPSARASSRHDGIRLATIAMESSDSPEPDLQAFIAREHEFRFLQVHPDNLDGTPARRSAVVCGRWRDEPYRQRRCSTDEEWHQRYGKHGVDRVWRDDVLPCRCDSALQCQDTAQTQQPV